MNYLLLLLLAICAIAQPPLPELAYIGQTIDPVTFSKGITVISSADGTCITSDAKWTYPCFLSVESQQTTSLTMNSNSYTSTTDYEYDGTTKVDISASIGYGKFSAKGSFSESTENYIHNIVTESMTFVTSEVEMVLYIVTTPVMSAPPSAEFVDYITTLCSKLDVGDMDSFNYWMAQFVQDVGYLTITSLTSGGRLSQTQYVTDDYYSNTDKDVVTKSASASASFADLFSASGTHDWGVTTTEVDTFKSESYYIQTTAIGGPYIANKTIAEWQQSATLNPGVLQYSVSKTSQWINTYFFPTLDPANIQRIYDTYEGIWTPYILANSKLGCTDKTAINFNLTATVSDDSCQYVYETGSTFGGTYGQQTFYEGSIAPVVTNLPNPFTGGLSCPPGTLPHCVAPTSIWKIVNFAQLQVVEEFCVCHGSQGDTSYHGYGGIYGSGVGIPTSYVQWSGTTNINGGPSCPSGFRPAVMSGVGYSVTTCYADAPTASYTFGGVYWLVNGACSPNPYTGTCGCPANAPFVAAYGMEVALYVKEYPPTSIDNVVIGVCWGQPALVKNPNPGPLPTYNAMVYQPTNSTTPPHKKHSDTGKHVLIAIVVTGFAVVGLGIVVACVFVVIRTYRSRRSGYAQV